MSMRIARRGQIALGLLHGIWRGPRRDCRRTLGREAIVARLGAAAATAHGTTIANLAAAATIALVIRYGWHPQAALAIQISIAVLYWLLGQGLGGVLTGRATDVGTALLMIDRLHDAPIGSYTHSIRSWCAPQGR